MPGFFLNTLKQDQSAKQIMANKLDQVIRRMCAVREQLVCCSWAGCGVRETNKAIKGCSLPRTFNPQKRLLAVFSWVIPQGGISETLGHFVTLQRLGRLDRLPCSRRVCLSLFESLF